MLRRCCVEVGIGGVAVVFGVLAGLGWRGGSVRLCGERCRVVRCGGAVRLVGVAGCHGVTVGQRCNGSRGQGGLGCGRAVLGENGASRLFYKKYRPLTIGR